MANRRQNTEHSYTFHGRDVYAYTGAKLASGHISFEEVGPELSVDQIVELPVVETIIEDHLVKGAIDILDVRFWFALDLYHARRILQAGTSIR